MSDGVPASKMSLAGKMAGSVASHPRLALAVMAFMAVTIIWYQVYYKGILFVGPYAKTAAVRKKAAGAGRRASASAGKAEGQDGEDPEQARTESEVKQLIRTIENGN
jgi:hypothetical protein